jgi:peptide/nickel transport system substrate-binding protein
VIKRRWVTGIAVVGVLSLVAAACSSNTSGGSSTSSGTAEKGGTYRSATQSLANTNAFDPVGEYYGYAWALYQNLMLRGLYNYNHVAGEEGNVPQPDLATGPPEISEDGLTWTFTIRDDVAWGPPLERMVTTQDIEFAFERINMASLAALYGNYYCGVIKGMTCAETEFKKVSGIETPDATHITFHLENPTGDFLYRVAMPASYPAPEEVAGCFTKSAEYGSDFISNGAYMIFGQDELDISSCDTIKPMAGINLDKGMTIVRNPNFDEATEDPAMYSNFLDGVTIEVNSNLDDIFQKIQAGDLDGTAVGDVPPPTVEQEYATDPDLQQFLHSDPGDRTWYMTMNLLAPPFDDIHVRKAVNYVIDKAALVKGYGGSLHSVPATTVEPPTVLPNLADYNPYPSENFAGDATAAMEEMKQSKYDTDQDGQCDAPECTFLLLGRNDSPWTNMNPIVVQNLAKIGLKATLKEVDASTQTATLYTVKKLTPMSIGGGWGKDFGSPFGFDYFVFDGAAGIACTGAVDESLIGMTPEQAAECGVTDEYNASVEAHGGTFPSIDKKMDECVQLVGEELNTCFAELDTYLMEEAVGWVPWSWGQNLTVTGPTVTQYVYDQNGGAPAFAHIAVSNGLPPENVA